MTYLNRRRRPVPSRMQRQQETKQDAPAQKQPVKPVTQPQFSQRIPKMNIEEALALELQQLTGDVLEALAGHPEKLKALNAIVKRCREYPDEILRYRRLLKDNPNRHEELVMEFYRESLENPAGLVKLVFMVIGAALTLATVAFWAFGGVRNSRADLIPTPLNPTRHR